MEEHHCWCSGVYVPEPYRGLRTAVQKIAGKEPTLWKEYLSAYSAQYWKILSLVNKSHCSTVALKCFVNAATHSSAWATVVSHALMVAISFVCRCGRSCLGCRNVIFQALTVATEFCTFHTISTHLTCLFHHI